MEMSQNTLALFDAYAEGVLSTAEREMFDKRLKSEEGFEEAYLVHRAFLIGMERFGKKSLISRFRDVEESQSLIYKEYEPWQLPDTRSDERSQSVDSKQKKSSSSKLTRWMKWFLGGLLVFSLTYGVFRLLKAEGEPAVKVKDSTEFSIPDKPAIEEGMHPSIDEENSIDCESLADSLPFVSASQGVEMVLKDLNENVKFKEADKAVLLSDTADIQSSLYQGESGANNQSTTQDQQTELIFSNAVSSDSVSDHTQQIYPSLPTKVKAFVLYQSSESAKTQSYFGRDFVANGAEEKKVYTYEDGSIMVENIGKDGVILSRRMYDASGIDITDHYER